MSLPKESHSLTENIHHLVDTIIGQNSSDDFEFNLEDFEKSIVRGHLLHKEKKHWVKRYCKLTESEMFIYKSQESWENAEEPVDSCFIKSSVLDTPDLKDVPFVFSLFSHNKEGNMRIFFKFFQDVFSAENREKFEHWHDALNYLINGVTKVEDEELNIKVVNPNQNRNSINVTLKK
jgi:hypothetical protein